MRKYFGHCLITLLSLVLFTMAIPMSASAYVDPGTGSMLWQVAAATMIGTLFYVRRIAGWIRQQIGGRSSRATGFIFASAFALAASPVILQVFGSNPAPRFNDIFLVGIVLVAYLFTWESAAFLLVISLLLSAWVLPPNGSLRVQGFAEWFQIASFAAVAIFLICLIRLIKASRGMDPAVAERRRVAVHVMAGGAD